MKSLIVIGLMLICVFKSNCTLLVKLGTPEFAAYMFRTVISYWLFFPLE